MTCMDVLKYLLNATKAIFSNFCIQNCIIHQIRKLMKYVSYKYRKDFMSDLNRLPKVGTEEIALAYFNQIKNE